MKKHKTRKTRKLKITVVGTSKIEENPNIYIPHFRQLAMQAEQYLVPLILSEHLDPAEALELIAMHTHSLMTNIKDAWLSEQTVYTISALILTCWKYQQFTPSDRFPYTFDQVFEAWGGELLDIRQFMKPGARAPFLEES